MYHSVSLHTVAHMIFCTTLADEINFVKIKDSFNLRYTWLPLFSSKSGIEDLAGYSHSLAFQISRKPLLGADVPYSIKKSSSEDSKSICRSLCLSNNYTERLGIQIRVWELDFLETLNPQINITKHTAFPPAPSWKVC